MPSTAQIQKMGSTTTAAEALPSQYKYTIDVTPGTLHLTSIDSGIAVWRTNPAAFPAITDQTDANGLTDYYLFDTDFSGWTSSGEGSSGGATWTRLSGNSPTLETGPLAAVTGSFYVYTEVDGFVNQTFSLEKSISLSKELACISFYYHMFGSGIGTLNLDVKIGATWYTLWTRTGQQQGYANTGYGGAKKYQLNNFKNIAVYLSNYDGVIASPAIDKTQIISVRFKYTATASVIGDCAIDSVALSYNP